MSKLKRMLAVLTATVLLVSCIVAGIALPVSAEGDTFKLGETELFLAPPNNGYVVYSAIPVLTLTNEAYTGTVTWKSSKTGVATVGSSSGLIETKAAGTTTITATNAEGESHTCTLTVAWDGEILTGGTFESKTSWNVKKWTTEIIASGRAEVVEDPDDPTNHVLKVPAGMATKYSASLAVKPGKKYLVSFDIKGEMTGPTNEIKPLYISNSTNNGWKYAFPIKGEWRHYAWTFTTVSSGLNRNYVLGLANQNIGGGSNTNPYYLDNISVIELGTAESIELSSTAVDMEVGDETTLSVSATPAGATYNRVTWSSSDEQVVTVDKNGKITATGVGSATITATSGVLKATSAITVHEEMLAAVPDAGLTGGAIATDGTFGIVQPDDIVTVTVTPDEGYLMIPGTLRYTNKEGKTVYVLNKDFENGTTFGQGQGDTFKFVMPGEKVTLTADFVSTADQTFAANTIGTSCRYTVDENDEKVYDGIRFLTRLNLAAGFDTETNILNVKYNGKDYTVLELGSLLKREQNATELTYENAVANQQSGGVNRMWVSKAYTKNSGVFKLVDYTESYIDFTSVMLTSHYDRFYTARGYIRLQAEDESVITLEFDEITNSISSVVPILPPVQDLEGVTAEKTNWTPVAHTVEPGQKLNYTITVKAGDKAGKVTVFEPIPANANYVSGADRLVGKTAVWELDLAANETKTLNYVIEVKNDMALCEGGIVEGTATQVGSTTIDPCHMLYIDRSVSKFDEYYVNNAIKSLEDASYTNLTLIYHTFNTAYSSSITGFRKESGYNGYKAADLLDAVIHGDGTVSYTYKNSSTDKDVAGSNNHLDNVAPTLYGGSEVSGQIEGVKGAPAASVSESDLMIGDVLIVKNGGKVSLYIYSGDGLMIVKETGGYERVDAAVLSTLTESQAYLVLRVRNNLKSTSSSFDQERETLTPEQEAVIKTGEAFLMRGEKVQYADTSLASYADYRWAKGLVSPESASAISWKYTNCAAFCYDSYYFALNYALGSGDMYTTDKMAQNTSMRHFVLERTVNDSYTDAEKAALQQQFMDTLQPGDLMIVRRSGGSGHVMMYIGNGKMIHSSGSNFRYTWSREIYEASIRYGQVYDYFFRPTSTSGYIFGNSEDPDANQVIKTSIIRPLDKFNGTIPENTQNRIDNLTGVVVQKLASHTVGQTVSAGGNITYTFSIRNTNKTAVTLDVVDTIPANTTYVSGGDTFADGTLTWSVTVPAGETREVSFTVKVNDDVAKDTLIKSTGGKVGGVAVGVRDITVANTLTEAQQTAVIDAFNALKAEGTTLTGFELANEIYKNAGITDQAFASTDAEVIALDATDGVFASNSSSGPAYVLHSTGAYREMMAPTLYGGRAVDSALWDQTRSRMPREEQLIIGDILLRRTSSATTVYLYIGGTYLINLTNSGANDSYNITYRLESTCLTSGKYFAVLRPSMVIE